MKRMWPLAFIAVLLAAFATIVEMGLQRLGGGQRSQLGTQAGMALPQGGHRPMDASAGVAAGRSYPAMRGRAFTLDDVRTPLPPGTALEVLRTLRPMAEAGDAKAALSLYLKLADCRNALTPISEQELAAYRTVGAGAAFLSASERKTEACAGLDAGTSQPGKWLEQAADAGLLEAQLLYASDARSIIGPPSAWLSTPGDVQRYKTKAVAFLDGAARKGNVEAMLALGASYSGGDGLFKKDRIRGYAYYRLAEIARPGLVYDELFRALESDMSVEEVERANALAGSMFVTCCK